ncbi:MAG TPA: acetyl-CoA hydrolase/transferase C-terminal domain-containing protein [Deltaproteobacteria bacterium]|nr:4-hydroxybutyrate CoA-transferase [Deltaproteobacteria bacterium]HRW81539.1 acetyl-CoA hydrolase/transferase C-terminal domain-containing protein [Desulfomonilia bacterium]NMD41055.1 4-hydroxybutyrate CoA-transferase [Deltaproteobacteria bacterium]HOY75902.1 acetyl-CoA hydrolase/transferase C-terminal domain-containing protein [Deltaproteobacteria bacterium]HPA76923.1 acetyl-CoA hydrolase/transferase C-terminal domain-containing protein [Deltaproteobacteria bacterium]
MAGTAALKGWKDDYQHKLVTAEEAAAQVKSGDWIIVPPVNSVPIDILNALAARKDEIQKVKIASNLMIYPFAFLGGDYVGKITYYTGYCGPLERMFMPQGNIVPFPMHLSKAYIALDRAKTHDVAMIEVTPPDGRGYMNYGPCGVAYGRYATKRCSKVIAQVNSKTPWIHGFENTVHVSEVDFIVEKDHDLPVVPEIEITDVEKKIGEFIAERIPNEATIQLGIGGIPNAVAYFLHEKKDLGVHAEILSDAVAELGELGVITGMKKTIFRNKIGVGGLIIGTKRLLDFCDNNPAILSMPIQIANHYDTIRGHDNLCSINSALTVDLTGQIASETIGHSQYSATGGQADFVRGAIASRGGKSFIALPATGKNKDGSLMSRIVLNFAPGTVVTTPRSDAMYVVTEYGVADLFMKSIPDRVKAMISIAHPDFREDLERQAFEAGLLIPATLPVNV